MESGRLERACAEVAGGLLAERAATGGWTGELSTSALSTATAACALSAAERAGVGADGDARRLDDALGWLARRANGDGGFGDTPDSPSNVSTTTLAWVALGCRPAAAGPLAVRARAEVWLARAHGGLDPSAIARGIGAAYGSDRTFAAPILALCAQCGAFGSGAEAWRDVPHLPFELAALPRGVFRTLGLPMVSYALPALIAIGQLVHHHRPTRNPLARVLRDLARERTLTRLAALQPTNGGFLEATPLTSFVALSLIGCERARHPVVARSLSFLRGAQRADGGWPIDTNLAIWVTTLALDALAAGGRLGAYLAPAERERLRAWLLARQFEREHPYTGAAPGGFAWTDLPGGVPDADDTAGALIALAHLGSAPIESARAGVGWLLDLQNRDGGIPTFCRGWSELPFDRSSPDITAHALRAWSLWTPELEAELGPRLARARRAALDYLARTQRADGAWIPLWFGSQREPRLENPLYGTARVLAATAEGVPTGRDGALARATRWLLEAQHADGGFGAGPGSAPTVEETALAVRALAERAECGRPAVLVSAVQRGAAWLGEHLGGALPPEPAPIGLYFARLWYSERLYPLIFACGALERAAALLARPSRLTLAGS